MHRKSFRVELPPHLLNKFDAWRGGISRNDAISGILQHILASDLKLQKPTRPLPQLVEGKQ